MKILDPSAPAARDLASERYRIRPMSGADLARITIPWMRDAGWNPGLHDATTFPSADPEGFLVGELDGTPIASVSAVRYDDRFGFMGCYLVQAPFRGLGYGMAIHEAGRRHLAGCIQGGDGVLENVAKYERIGRVLAYRNARFQGQRPARVARPTDLVDASNVPISAFLSLDRACFPACRESFLTAWLRQPDATALYLPGPASAATSRPGSISSPAGFGVIRPCFDGWKIGPLFAQSPTAAETLFTGLLASIPAGDRFQLDVPLPNQAAVVLAKRHGLVEVFATARMYTGPAPDVRLDWIYGVTTFELG